MNATAHSLIWWGRNLPDSDNVSALARVRVSDRVLFQEIDSHAALLNLDSELYFGLDDVGTRMWKLLVDTDSIGAAAEALIAIYDGAPEQIRDDLLNLVGELQKHGLIEIDS